MIVVNQNLIQKSFLVFIEIESIKKSEKLENGFSEFQSLVYSSGVQVIDFVKFKQKNPIANNFISAGHLEKIKYKVSLEQQSISEITSIKNFCYLRKFIILILLIKNPFYLWKKI